MPRFELLPGGLYQDNEGNNYKPGDVFESSADLDKLFANRFRRIDSVTKQAKDHDELPDHAGKVMDKPLAATVKHSKKQAAAMANAKAKSKEKVIEDDDVEDETENNNETEEEEEDFGADVTERFPKASRAGVQVFKGSDGYIVVKDGKAVSDWMESKEVTPAIKALKAKVSEDDAGDAEEATPEKKTASKPKKKK